MVEGGTLLRCYTSQRGIEGSNPSSSAPETARLQDKRWGNEEGRDSSRPLLHQRVHQRGQNTATTNTTSVTVHLYPRRQKLWSPSRRSPPRSTRKGAPLPPHMQDCGYELPRTQRLKLSEKSRMGLWRYPTDHRNALL